MSASPDPTEPPLDRAASHIAAADALLITAGAGMGVDSGLPDFRGPEGFWRAYPAYRHLGLDFESIANLEWFLRKPELGWGFYGHRLNLYRQAQPHAGFGILLRWAARMPHGAFVFTSNVDGLFLRAGFPPDRLAEVHGNIHYAQCLDYCGAGVFSADSFVIHINESTFLCEGDLPRCPSCGALARPNILMFGDGGWDPARFDSQRDTLSRWSGFRAAKLVIIELGAGRAVPTIRHFSEKIAVASRAPLIRVNLREPEFDASFNSRPGDLSHVGLPLSALSALQSIDQRLNP